MRGLGMLGLGSIGSLLSLLDTPIMPRLPHHMGGERGSKWNRHSTYHATNGTRECARRLRQIEVGRLTVANGVAAVVS